MASCFDVLWHMIAPAETFQIDGHSYTVISRLGEGGFAVVDLVESSRDGRRYALKRVQLASHDARMIGELELSMLRKLDHPSIVRLHASSRISSNRQGQPDQLLMLLDYYPRGSLQDHINTIRNARIRSSSLWILRVFINICEGVQQIHQLEPVMAHRDLKPDNIMLGVDSQVAIIDFGSSVVARRQVADRYGLQELIEESERMCTPTFRAPELWDRGIDDILDIDERIDVWALGCILYTLMFNVGPFDLVEPNGGNLKLAVIQSNFSFPANHAYPQALCDFVTYMLNKDEKERPFISDVLKRANELSNSPNI